MSRLRYQTSPLDMMTKGNEIGISYSVGPHYLSLKLVVLMGGHYSSWLSCVF